ncbi:MAG TPA: lytic transglycosylase domain-containing protein [Abditibacteriaceae bacterium]
MKKNISRVVVLAGLGLSPAVLPGAWAQTGNNPVSSTGSSVATRSDAMPSYEQLRRSYKVNAGITLAQVRSDAASHAGRVIELQGTITGVMTMQTTRTMLMQVDGSTLALSIPDSLNTSVMRSGSSVRALALVGRVPERNEAVLTVVAMTEQLAPAPWPVAEELSTTGLARLAPATKPLMAGDVIISPETSAVVPPMTRMRPGLPEPPAARPPAVQALRPGLDPNADDVWSSQKVAFKAAARRFNKKLSDAQAAEIAQAMVDAGRAHGMDPRFLASIIAVESSFDIYCLSRSGAMGLGQIMPFNLREAGITNAWNPTQNIFGAARLLRGHLNSFGNRPDGTLLAVAAYNAGPNAVRRAGYKVPNGSQVQRYVWKVYYQYKAFAPELFR